MEQHFGSCQLIVKYNCPCQLYTVVGLENLRRTDREERIQLQRPLLSPVDCWGERANLG